MNTVSCSYRKRLIQEWERMDDNKAVIISDTFIVLTACGM